MSRTSRIKSKYGFYHVILRGINHSLIFNDDADYQYFLNLIKKYSAENNCGILAYAFLGNHLHLLIKDNDDTLSRFMGQTASAYAGYFNQRHERSGNLFQDRFGSENIENDTYLLTVLRYIHQNPMKACITPKLEYKWSSYNQYFAAETFIDKTLIMQLLGNSIKRFISFNNEPTGLTTNSPVKFIDVKNKKLSDSAALSLLKKTFKTEPLSIARMPRAERIKIIKFLLSSGATGRQLSRILSIPQSNICRIS